MKQFEIYKNKLQNYFNNNDYSGAQNFIANTIDSEKDELLKAEKYYDFARLLNWQKKYREAIENLKTAVELNPENKYYLIELALNLEKIGEIDTAINILITILESDASFHFLESKILELGKILVNPNKSDGKNKFTSLLNTFRRKTKKESNFPLISIIILGFNKVEYSKKCLLSVLKNTRYENYEIIFLDNASSDETSTIIQSFGRKVLYLRSNVNLGFVKGNNFASERAKGEYLVFLNNDTEVKSEWLNSLYNTFVFHPDAGAVGSKLLYPDGTLQEAGGVIFNDATGWNFGRGDSPLSHLYDFTREVDYCSGASLMVKTDLFEKLGGFDEQFAPAYYEDTDLCFSIRKSGYKVYYCHASHVIHYEGITAGTDLSKGFKKYQTINRPKFINKWKKELTKQYPPNPELKLRFFNRNKAKRILIIDDIPPLPNQAAGALRHYHTLKQMLELGYQVTYVHLMGQKYFGTENFEYFHEFKMKGVEFIWFNYEYWWEFRKTTKIKKTLKNLIESVGLKQRNFDYIYIVFWYIAEYFIDFIRAEIPDTPILIDTMDIHFLREIREAEIKKDSYLLSAAKENKKRELQIYQKADCITTVTMQDRDILRKEIPDKAIFILTDVHDPIKNVRPFGDRKDLLFVGNFNHKPNEDAVFYFVEKIFPAIKAQLPDIKFYVVGANPSPKLQSLANKSIIVTGWVPKIEPYLEKCRISVVPLRFGAGNKGKVAQSLSFGVPIVTTSIGAEGMGIQNRKHALISDSADEFAKLVVELYTNKQLWEKLSRNGQNLIASLYTSRLMRERLHYIFSFETRESLKTTEALEYPEPKYVSVVIPSFNNKEYLEQTINSILQNTYLQKELIIVDNNSDNETQNYLKNLSEQKKALVIFNRKNEGFPKAVNQGILKSKGKFVLIANNDIIAPENAIKRMVEIADSSEKIGIVAPVSNYVSGMQLDKNANYSSLEEMKEYARKTEEKNKGKILEFPRVAFLFTLIKRNVIEAIGGLDERFSPGNFEDDDFCLRAQLAGFSTVIAQDVFVHHFGSKSFKKDNKTYDDLIENNLQIFKLKWGADPEEIWLQGKQIKQRNIFYPLYSSPFETHFERALILSEEGDLYFATEELENALKHFDNYTGKKFQNITKADILHLAGTILLQTGNYEKAVKYFERELEEKPDSITPLESIAETYLKAGIKDVAEEIAKTILQLDPANQTGKNILARILQSSD